MSKTDTEDTRNPTWMSHHITTGLIVLLIAELIGISGYTYLKVWRQMQTANLVDEAEQAVRKHYPEIRSQIKREIQNNASLIAQQVSDEVVASSPDVRQWLEKVVARQVASGLDEVTELSAEQFRQFVRENRDPIESAFEQLEEAPERTRQLVLELETRMDEKFGVDLQKQARVALGLHRDLNEKLDRLSSDAPLIPKELLERRIVRILRTLEEKRLPNLAQSESP